jgi:hypothetical protein
MLLLAGRHIYGKSHIDLIVETFLDLPVRFVSGRRGDGLTETETVAARRADALTSYGVEQR